MRRLHEVSVLMYSSDLQVPIFVAVMFTLWDRSSEAAPKAYWNWPVKLGRLVNMYYVDLLC